MQRILVFGDCASLPEICKHLQGSFDVQGVERNGSVGDLLNAGKSEHTVGIVARAETTAELTHLMREAPAGIPLFVIAPANADEELLGEVAQVAADFVVEPARPCEVLQRIRRITGAARDDVAIVQERLVNEIGLRQLVGREPAFLRVIAQIPTLARSNQPVLITGETGTGKELCARAIHQLGRRRDYPFIAVDCGAFPDHLFENEMFGHVRGAFTDAYRDQRGLVAMAEGGTLFLDEVDSLSISSQAKLLRFLQERTYRSLGSDKFVRAQVNVITASNRDLETLVREKQFRPDLFFRLAVLRIHMTPLRERRNDIPILARHFFDTLCAEEGIAPKLIAPATMVRLQNADWPGNVRELYNVVQRAFAFAEGSQILPYHLNPAGADSARANDERVNGNFRVARARAIEAFEREYVIDLLRAHNWNITQAARSAGQDRRALGRLVKRHKIQREAL